MKATLYAAAALALGHALQISNGATDAAALAWVAVALAAMLATLRQWPKAPTWLLPATLAVGFVWQFESLCLSVPGMYLLDATGPVTDAAHNALAQFQCAIALVGIVVAVSMYHWQRIGKYALVAVLLVFAYLGIWLIHASPRPFIDVWFQGQESAKALLSGGNPYAMTFPQIYGPTVDYLYGPGAVVDGRIIYGYTYPPLALLLSTVGYAVGGDYRYSLLAAMVGAALLMFYARPSRTAFLAATVYLFTPRSFFCLEQGWIDPYVVAAAALVVFAALRKPRLLGAALGLFLASKQYAVVMLPAAWLLVGPKCRVWRVVGEALVVAALVTLPLALPDIEACWRSVVEFQLNTPFRPDSLSFSAAMSAPGFPTWAGWGFVAWAACALACLRYYRRGASSFAGAAALVWVGFVSLGKQAHANYYHLAIGLCCIAVAAEGDA